MKCEIKTDTGWINLDQLDMNTKKGSINPDSICGTCVSRLYTNLKQDKDSLVSQLASIMAHKKEDKIEFTNPVESYMKELIDHGIFGSSRKQIIDRLICRQLEKMIQDGWVSPSNS